MVLLGDEAQLDARFGLFVGSANLEVGLVHGLCRTYDRLRNRFVRTLWYTYVTGLKWMLVLVCLEIVLILTQDMCTVYAKSTIGPKMVLDRPDKTPR
jgi:hypothetical protein